MKVLNLRVIMFFALLLLTGCVSCKEKRWEESEYLVPNWTSDNRIVFIEVKRYYKEAWNPMMGTYKEMYKKEIYLWEVNSDGSGYEVKGLLWENREPEITNLSSAGEWVVIGCGRWNEIWLVMRDGTNLHKLTNGKYPDFSPDAKKIVFVRDDGLYVINRDGSGIKKIFNEGKSPAWSPVMNKIACVTDQLIIIDTLGNIIDTLGTWKSMPDWTVSDTLKIIAYIPGKGNGLIIHLDTHSIDTLSIKTGDGAGFKWSPDGAKVVGHDANGWFVCNLDGTNKWYIKP